MVTPGKSSARTKRGAQRPEEVTQQTPPRPQRAEPLQVAAPKKPVAQGRATGSSQAPGRQPPAKPAAKPSAKPPAKPAKRKRQEEEDDDDEEESSSDSEDDEEETGSEEEVESDTSLDSSETDQRRRKGKGKGKGKGKQPATRRAPSQQGGQRGKQRGKRGGKKRGAGSDSDDEVIAVRRKGRAAPAPSSTAGPGKRRKGKGQGKAECPDWVKLNAIVETGSGEHWETAVVVSTGRPGEKVSKKLPEETKRMDLAEKIVVCLLEDMKRPRIIYWGNAEKTLRLANFQPGEDGKSLVFTEGPHKGLPLDAVPRSPSPDHHRQEEQDKERKERKRGRRRHLQERIRDGVKREGAELQQGWLLRMARWRALRPGAALPPDARERDHPRVPEQRELCGAHHTIVSAARALGALSLDGGRAAFWRGDCTAQRLPSREVLADLLPLSLRQREALYALPRSLAERVMLQGSPGGPWRVDLMTHTLLGALDEAINCYPGAEGASEWRRCRAALKAKCFGYPTDAQGVPRVPDSVLRPSHRETSDRYVRRVIIPEWPGAEDVERVVVRPLPPASCIVFRVAPEGGVLYGPPGAEPKELLSARARAGECNGMGAVLLHLHAEAQKGSRTAAFPLLEDSATFPERTVVLPPRRCAEVLSQLRRLCDDQDIDADIPHRIRVADSLLPGVTSARAAGGGGEGCAALLAAARSAPRDQLEAVAVPAVADCGGLAERPTDDGDEDDGSRDEPDTWQVPTRVAVAVSAAGHIPVAFQDTSDGVTAAPHPFATVPGLPCGMVLAGVNRKAAESAQAADAAVRSSSGSAVLHLLPAPLDEQQCARVLLRLADWDGDGRLNRDETAWLFERTGHPVPEVDDEWPLYLAAYSSGTDGNFFLNDADLIRQYAERWEAEELRRDALQLLLDSDGSLWAGEMTTLEKTLGTTVTPILVSFLHKRWTGVGECGELVGLSDRPGKVEFTFLESGNSVSAQYEGSGSRTQLGGKLYGGHPTRLRGHLVLRPVILPAVDASSPSSLMQPGTTWRSRNGGLMYCYGDKVVCDERGALTVLKSDQEGNLYQGPKPTTAWGPHFIKWAGCGDIWTRVVYAEPPWRMFRCSTLSASGKLCPRDTPSVRGARAVGSKMLLSGDILRVYLVLHRGSVRWGRTADGWVPLESGSGTVYCEELPAPGACRTSAAQLTGVKRSREAEEVTQQERNQEVDEPEDSQWALEHGECGEV